MLYDDYAKCAQEHKAIYGPRTLVVYEVGKFYEWYNCNENLGCDVHAVCDLLNIVCTRKSKATLEVSRNNPWMAGVPVCAFPKYIPILLDNDYTIVVVSQTPLNGGKTFERKVSEILSRGTYAGAGVGTLGTDLTIGGGGASSALSSMYPQPTSSVTMAVYLDWHEEKSSNNKFSKYMYKNVDSQKKDDTTVIPGLESNRCRVIPHAGCAIADVVTGACACHEIHATGRDVKAVEDELHRLVQEALPAEVVLVGRSGPPQLFDVEEFLRHLNVDPSCVRNRLCDYTESLTAARQITVNAQHNQSKGAFDTSLSVLRSVKHREHILRKAYPDTGFLTATEALDLEFRSHACAAFSALLVFLAEHNEKIIKGLRRPNVTISCGGEMLEWRTETENPGPESQEEGDRSGPGHEGREERGGKGGAGRSHQNREHRRLNLSYNAAQQLNIIQGGLQQQQQSRLAHRSSNMYSSTSVGGFSSSTKSTLLGLVDSCVTAPGRRFLREQLLCPLVDVSAIQKRLDAVEDRMKDPQALKEARSLLSNVVDLERLFRRITLKASVPRDFESLDRSLDALSKVGCRESVGRKIYSLRKMYLDHLNLNAYTTDVESHSQQTNAVVGNTSYPYARNVFLKGVFPEIDDLQRDVDHLDASFRCILDRFNELIPVPSPSSSSSSANPQARTAFRLEFCNVSTSSSSSSVGAGTGSVGGGGEVECTRTIVGTNKRCETLIKRYEESSKTSLIDEIDPANLQVRNHSSTVSKIWHPQFDRWNECLKDFDITLRTRVRDAFSAFIEELLKEHSENMWSIVDELARVDYACACAHVALLRRYVRPRIAPPPPHPTPCHAWIDAKGLRHPVVEAINDRIPHVRNDIYLGNRARGDSGEIDVQNRLSSPTGILLYGMNAAGKSCLMKAVALAVVMAQAGMYVAADSFELCPFEKIFTRIQSHDDLARGQSTFMVEMSELRSIMKRCDERSLAIGDEICSGTESVSALAIVGAAVQELLRRRTPFLFATHLHDLTRMLSPDGGCSIDGLRVCHLRVHCDPETKRLVYDRKLCEGQGETIYGLEVCKSLDMDATFIDAAHALRRKIMGVPSLVPQKTSRYNARLLIDTCAVCGKERAEETHHIRPQKEADERGFIGHFHKNSAFNLVPLCGACHDAVHRGEIDIKGYLQTSSGVQLDVERCYSQ